VIFQATKLCRGGRGSADAPWVKFVIFFFALLCTVCKTCALALTIGSQVLLLDGLRSWRFQHRSGTPGVRGPGSRTAAAPCTCVCVSIIGAYSRAFAPCCATHTRVNLRSASSVSDCKRAAAATVSVERDEDE
jgi:hypothetical protein